MNGQIVKLFAFILALFVLLLGFTSYWSVFDAPGLKANSENRRALLLEQRIHRGDIRSVDGQVIARSLPSGSGKNRIWIREYPYGGLFGNPIGYSYTERGRVGTELAHNDELIGEKSEFLSILDELSGHKQEGSTLVSSLDASVQQTALDGLAGQAGAVVAMIPKTGEIRAMVSTPEYDPNLIPDDYSQLNTDPAAPLFNRATQSGYPPGSTMKVVTATAALDTGEFDPDSTLDGSSPQTIDGVPLSNSQGESFGQIDFATALTYSVNTAMARVGERVGAGTLLDYMDRYGFNQKPEIDYPSFQLATSGVYDGSSLLTAADAIDVGRVAIGQERLLVTPLQMAEVAATVANRGERMCPRLWSKVIDVDQRVDELDPETCAKVMDRRTARQLTEIMKDVVSEGTGTAAALYGVDVAGKTGTAEVSGRPGCDAPNQAWFIGFAPADRPEIAVAVTVECTSGYGGDVAAPIAAQVMQEALDG
ncbi:MAG: peptidoglycan D,D-transpeptidase FtsI family protein [Solirubrobacterales bacterium]